MLFKIKYKATRIKFKKKIDELWLFIHYYIYGEI